MISFHYTCDGCGKKALGLVRGLTLVKLPPLGWKWCFHGPLEGPHACSAECWELVKLSPDGKLYLDWDHESEAGKAPWQTRAPAERPSAPVVPPAKPKVKAPRKHPLRDKVEALDSRVSKLEQTKELQA
jgi:hypothetical protein